MAQCIIKEMHKKYTHVWAPNHLGRYGTRYHGNPVYSIECVVILRLCECCLASTGIPVADH